MNTGSAAVDKSTERELLIHNSIIKEPVSSSAASQGDADELWGRLEKKASRSKTSGWIYANGLFCMHIMCRYSIVLQ